MCPTALPHRVTVRTVRTVRHAGTSMRGAGQQPQGRLADELSPKQGTTDNRPLLSFTLSGVDFHRPFNHISARLPLTLVLPFFLQASGPS
jgi:hypothetical protein